MSDDVRVNPKSNGLRLDVGHPTSLSRVVSAVCIEQRIKCTGTESLSSFHVPEMSMDGTLRQVIGTLLEGTEVNYSFSYNLQGSASEISFLGKAPRGGPVPPAATVSACEKCVQPAPAPKDVRSMFGGSTGSAPQLAPFKPVPPSPEQEDPQEGAGMTGLVFPVELGNDVTTNQAPKPGSPFPKNNVSPVDAPRTSKSPFPAPASNTGTGPH